MDNSYGKSFKLKQNIKYVNNGLLRLTMFGLTHEVLSAYQLKAVRNGNWRLLNGMQRGFYRACVVYARLRGSIVNPKLVDLLRGLIEKIRSTPKMEALNVAIIEINRMAPIYFRAGVFNWVPELQRWLQEEPYLIWLGLTKLNTPTIFQNQSCLPA